MVSHIIADVRFYNTEEGGRQCPTPGDQFLCLFKLNRELLEDNWDCRLYLHDHGPIAPGDRAVLPIAFLSPHKVIPHLKEGSMFYLRDGGIIGEGVVKEIVYKTKGLSENN